MDVQIIQLRILAMTDLFQNFEGTLKIVFKIKFDYTG